MKKLIPFVIGLLTLATSVSANAQAEVAFPFDLVMHESSPELTITSKLITELRDLNSQGQVLGAWKLLATQKDGYAISAVRIFGPDITVGKCTVEGNWKLTIGEENFKRFYKLYAQLYQRSYIEFLAQHQRYPKTVEIENLYRNADDALGLPQSVSVDLMLNLIPDDWVVRRTLDQIGTLAGEGKGADFKRWYHYTELSEARYSNEFITAKDVSLEHAKELYLANSKQVTLCMAAKLKFW